MGRAGHVRRSSFYRLYPSREQTAETDVHRSLAWHGGIFHRHDPASETQRQNRKNDRPGAHIEQSQPRQRAQINLPVPHAAGYGNICSKH